ncbi:MAG TPA: A24 family peptidase [Steroidobacteraceae bacterium]|jgi:leader peptidase (prepilin peptidase)/N-methyltransferase|nr:A24 family peptidase [Steroidobacteraceae bacterium]
MLSELPALYSAEPWLFSGSIFVLGLVVGSFLNVVIYRLPIMLEREWKREAAELLREPGGPTAEPERFTLSYPRSACPACRTPIRIRDNVPVMSWLILRGRCAACRARIPARYPIVELTTGILSAWVAWRFGFGVSTLCALLITWSLIALTGIDIDHQLLPDGITLLLMWAGLVASVLVGPMAGSSVPVSPTAAVLGAACGYSSLWLVFHLFKLVTGKEGMGYGDFKLYAALGAWLGWKVLPLIILLSAATGAVIGIGMVSLRGRDRAAPMPFGPYLAAAGWIVMMYGDSIVHGYLRASGVAQ